MRAPIACVALAVVTGAGSGIGRATALELGRRGLDVVLVGRTERSLRETADRAPVGARTRVLVADISRESDVERVARRTLAEVGTPRVVINNAGVAGRKARIEDLSADDWDAVMGPNLRGVFLVTRAFLPSMREAGVGRFVTIASISATLGSPGLAPYSASKWGAVGFTKSLAEELRGSGVQALSVLPGSVDTPMVKVGGFVPQMAPEDVARVVAFAAIDAPDAMNGSAIDCFGP